MSKFKVGDKVTPAMIDGEIGPGLYRNETYVVEVCEGEGIIDITGKFKHFPHTNAWGVNWSEDWFKLYEEKEKEMNAEQIRDEILRIDLRIEEAKKDIENAEKERNFLVEKLREKGFEIVKESPNHTQRLMEGDRVQIVGNTSGHYFGIGQTCEVCDVYDTYYQCFAQGESWAVNDRDLIKI